MADTSSTKASDTLVEVETSLGGTLTILGRDVSDAYSYPYDEIALVLSGLADPAGLRRGSGVSSSPHSGVATKPTLGSLPPA